MSGPNIEKRTGHDWTVLFRDDDGKLLSCSLFGINTAEQAAAQAHVDCSLPDHLHIVAVIRDQDVNDVLFEMSGDDDGD